MVLKELLVQITQKYQKNKIPFPRLEAETIFSFVLKKEKEWLYLHPNFSLSSRQVQKINKLAQKRLNNTPLAYILGYKEFYGLKFFVNKNVLIPRPETEILVEEVLKTKKGKKSAFIDIGTGSGNIIITLAKKINHPYSCFFGIDISSKALYIARKNSHLHKVKSKIKFIKGNLLAPLLQNRYLKTLSRASSLFITANLPYLTPKEIKQEKSIQKEPPLALVSGKDGLKHYRQLFRQLKALKNSLPNLPFLVFIELNPQQAKKALFLIKNHFPQSQIKIKKDLARRQRVIIFKT